MPRVPLTLIKGETFMRPATRYVIAVVFVCLGACQLLCVAQTKLTKSPAGTVSGRITIKGKPARGVFVTLRRMEAADGYEVLPRAITDQDGLYRITNIAAGSYEVTPFTLPFVLTETTARSKAVIIGEAENVEDINFSLLRGGVITGKVTDADGHPVIQQTITLFRADAFEQRSPQRRQIYQVASAATDDRGIYRMFGLAPGRYKVAAGRGDETFSPSILPGRASFQQVFHPDVTDQAKATIIEVNEGSEATNIDITLGRAMPTFSASGRIIDEQQGLPFPYVRFGLQRLKAQSSEYVQPQMTTNSNGDFIIEGLIPGKYAVIVNMPNSDVRAESATFEIIDADVSGITIKMSKGASLAGTVVLEQEDRSAWAKLVQMRLSAFVPNEDGSAAMNRSSSASIGGDGSFRIGGLPAGIANFFLSGRPGNPQATGFTISRVERDGVVHQRGIEIKEGEEVTGIRVVMAYGNATLRGIVNLENGTLPANGSIFVRITRAGEMSSNIRPPRVDARGHFLIQGIPGGLYDVSVSVFVPGTRSRTSTNQQVTVQDGVATDMTITVDLANEPKP
jgi:protocatechuate 3,4-dioxygenase beta subunit